MKVYIIKDVHQLWRVQIDKPVWRDNRFGFEMPSGSTVVCTNVVSKIFYDLGFDHREFKTGQFLECDLT